MKTKAIALALAALMAAAPAAQAGKLVRGGSNLGLTAGPTAPSCLAGWQTQEKKSWILVCRIIVAPELKNATIAAGNGANCQVNSYWNYGPNVKILQNHPNFVEMTYTCGHVEG